MRSDDLVPILAGQQGRGLTLLEGTVNTWNTTTGANSITVAGGVFTDLRVIGTAAGVAAGNQVVILALGNAWYVLGKLIRP